MNVTKIKLLPVAALLVLVLLLPETAAAFRCGTKLVKDGMHEAEVIAICGKPATVRRMGYAIRSVSVRDRHSSSPGLSVSRGGSYYYPVEVMVTEHVYNFGPQKFMRRVVFEGGRVAHIERLGRGYRE